MNNVCVCDATWPVFPSKCPNCHRSVMPPDNNDAWKLLQELVATEPVAKSTDLYDYCAYCDGKEGGGDTFMHEEKCPWRRAKAMLARGEEKPRGFPGQVQAGILTAEEARRAYMDAMPEDTFLLTHAGGKGGIC